MMWPLPLIDHAPHVFSVIIKQEQFRNFAHPPIIVEGGRRDRIYDRKRDYG